MLILNGKVYFCKKKLSILSVIEWVTNFDLKKGWYKIKSALLL